MNRIEFFEGISGIDYPEMLVNFFDQFVALKSIVEDSGSVQVIDNKIHPDGNIEITFFIEFISNDMMNKALAIIDACGYGINVYGRYIKIAISSTDKPNKIMLNLR